MRYNEAGVKALDKVKVLNAAMPRLWSQPVLCLAQQSHTHRSVPNQFTR